MQVGFSFLLLKFAFIPGKLLPAVADQYGLLSSSQVWGCTGLCTLTISSNLRWWALHTSLQTSRTTACGFSGRDCLDALADKLIPNSREFPTGGHHSYNFKRTKEKDDKDQCSLKSPFSQLENSIGICTVNK